MLSAGFRCRLVEKYKHTGLGDESFSFAQLGALAIFSHDFRLVG